MVEMCSSKHTSFLQKHSNDCKGKGMNVGRGMRTLAKVTSISWLGQKPPVSGAFVKISLYKSETESERIVCPQQT